MIVPTALLMLKAPVEGAVKTRLGRDIGPAAATCAYRALVEHQLRQIPPQWHVHICYAPDGALAAMRAWLGDEREYSAQAGGDLGERLAAATVRHFERSGGPLVILGGDCPYLSRERLIEAAVALENTDAAVVPAADGGYCLIALRRAELDVFRSISWSTVRCSRKPGSACGSAGSLRQCWKPRKTWTMARAGSGRGKPFPNSTLPRHDRCLDAAPSRAGRRGPRASAYVETRRGICTPRV